jgi:hypothetical protein
MATAKDYSTASFLSVLTDAVTDMTDNGFDSPVRLAKWMRLLREAAIRQFDDLPVVEDMLRAALRSVYAKHVDGEQILRLHPGVEPFTLQQVKPKLRDELDKRIAASADLIKLNRAEAIEKTMARFAGWGSSIPAGGTAEPDKREAKATIKRGISGLPFIERRVVIDQGHKLTNAISTILADDAGAIAGVWHSHWRQPGYDYREDHKERDEQVYLVRGSWAHNDGLVKPGDVGFADSVTQPGEEPFCRCFWSWLYNIRDLPTDMLTEKGKQKLQEVRSYIEGTAS